MQKPRSNRQIRAEQVRLIDQHGEQLGIFPLDDALMRASSVGLDLVEISPTAEPPVCRILDFGKYLFEEGKKQAASRKKQKKVHIKEVKFRPNTDEGDYQVKLRNMLRFLEAGDKVKVTLRFKGREVTHSDIGLRLLARLETDLVASAQVEQAPKREGRQQMVMVLVPKRK